MERMNRLDCRELKFNPELSKKRLKKIASMKDAELDFSEIPELDEKFWKRAELVLPQPKKAISFRVDRDVLDWFRAKGKGYQSLMNAVLKSYVDAVQEK